LDQQHAFLETVFVGDFEDNYGDHPDVATWLIETDHPNLTEWLIDMLPQIVYKGSSSRCSKLMIAFTKSHPVRYLCDPVSLISLLVSRDPPGRQTRGWTSFSIAGHYFYSPNIYLDLRAPELTGAFDYGMVCPDHSSEPLTYPEQEHLVAIAYGPDYRELVTIPAPLFLLDWHRDSGIGTKGARSGEAEC
jgi:hypothetical protein